MNDTAQAVEGPKKKPEIILYYNTTRGGVDSMEKMAKPLHAIAIEEMANGHISNMISLKNVAGRVI
ncbi:hypothetical protein PoB_000914000, partial [Plakobranchus ocellatus]